MTKRKKPKQESSSQQERVRKVHCLKTWPDEFQAMLSGRKRYDIRVNDRDFQEGDTLALFCWDPTTCTYSGEEARFCVDYITRGGSFGLPADLCVMSVSRNPDETNWEDDNG